MVTACRPWSNRLFFRCPPYRTWKTSTGYEYKIPAALTGEQVVKLIPKDILIFNWFWDDINNDRQLAGLGFQQVYGNLLPEIDHWNDRKKTKGLLGGAPSSWAATTEMNIGKDQLYDFLGTANLLWSEHYLSADQLTFITEGRMSRLYRNLSGVVMPSDNGSAVSPIDISPYFNASLSNATERDDAVMIRGGSVTERHQVFKPASNGNKNCIMTGSLNAGTGTPAVTGIPINSDANSMIFLHACVKQARNQKAYSMIYNFDDTADLLGWYEIIYADGMVETVPIRYGVNILDWKWKQRILNQEKEKVKYSQDRYAYQASAVECAGPDAEPVTFFSFEWQNVRPGQVIREINLKSVEHSAQDKNAVILLAVSMTGKK